MKNSVVVTALSVALVGVASAETVAPKAAPVSDVMTLVSTSTSGGETRYRDGGREVSHAELVAADISLAQIAWMVAAGILTVVAVNEANEDKNKPVSP